MAYCSLWLSISPPFDRTVLISSLRHTHQNIELVSFRRIRTRPSNLLYLHQDHLVCRYQWQDHLACCICIKTISPAVSAQDHLACCIRTRPSCLLYPHKTILFAVSAQDHLVCCIRLRYSVSVLNWRKCAAKITFF